MKPITTCVFLLAASLALMAAGPKRKPKSKLPAPSRILNVEALQPFLRALGDLDQPGSERVVRVLHFGDSHTAADLWTGQIRRRLQARFGDAGPGLVLPGRPWRGYSHEGVRFLSGRDWPAQSLRNDEGDRWVGLPGAAVSGVGGEVLRVRAAFDTYAIQVVAPPGCVLHGALSEATADAAVADQAPTLAPLARISEAVLSDGALMTFGSQETSRGLSVEKASPRVQDLVFSLPEDARLLGVDLRSGRPGLLYDELGLNGAQFLDLEKWNPELRKALLTRAKPDLIVLAYGTNDEGLSAASLENYQARMRALLRTFKEDSRASILVIGPLDRFGTRRCARPALKAGALRVIGDMKQACLAEGCAFWDAREAMGGYGSIRQWRRSGWAKRDLVHLTARGYELLGDKFCDQLIEAYEHRRNAPMPAGPLGGRKTNP